MSQVSQDIPLNPSKPVKYNYQVNPQFLPASLDAQVTNPEVKTTLEIKKEEKKSVSTEINLENLQKLRDMGFEGEQAKIAIRLAKGNLEYAINLLFSGQQLAEPSIQKPVQPNENQELTPIDLLSVDKLKAMGFSDVQARQAYIASGKNEELAINWLLEESGVSNNFKENQND